MNQAQLQTRLHTYRDGLLQDTVPFWLNHGLDAEHGGIMTSLDRDGSVIDTDKGVWQQGRFIWMLSTLCRDVEARPEWLEAAGRAASFLLDHGFDRDGRMFFLLTREGKPLRKRRYLFSECFASIGLAAYAAASGDDSYAQRAREVFATFRHYIEHPELLEPKVNPDVRPAQGIAIPMIGLNVAQELRDTIGDPACVPWIDRCIEQIRTCFVKPELNVVMETVAPDGSIIDHFDGRLLNPGHAIEASWFILHEAAHRQNDADLIALGTNILDWMWEWGWDQAYGGLWYFRDLKGYPVQEYWHDMKFWWPHNEAIIATLLAYHLTGKDKYLRWYEQVHDWAYAHFPDTTHGEWFGYLHRDGRLSVPLKGNHWKGMFHLPRMQWYCWRLLEKIQHTETRTHS